MTSTDDTIRELQTVVMSKPRVTVMLGTGTTNAAELTMRVRLTVKVGAIDESHKWTEPPSLTLPRGQSR